MLRCCPRGAGDCIGEMERNLKAKFMEHRRPCSSTSEGLLHINKDCPGHNEDNESVRILDRAPSWFKRAIKEAINIQAHKPVLKMAGAITISCTL